MPVDRRTLFGLDWVLLGATLALCLIGVATIASATQTGRYHGLHIKQLYLVGAGVLRFVLRDDRTEARRVGIAPARGGGVLTWTRSF